MVEIVKQDPLLRRCEWIDVFDVFSFILKPLYCVDLVIIQANG